MEELEDHIKVETTDFSYDKEGIQINHDGIGIFDNSLDHFSVKREPFADKEQLKTMENEESPKDFILKSHQSQGFGEFFEPNPKENIMPAIRVEITKVGYVTLEIPTEFCPSQAQIGYDHKKPGTFDMCMPKIAVKVLFSKIKRFYFFHIQQILKKSTTLP